MILNFVKKHILILLYSIVVLILVYGSTKTTGVAHLSKIAIHGFSAVLFYTMFYFVLIKKGRLKIEALIERFQLSPIVAYVIAIATIVQIVIHLIALGGSPAIEALSLGTTEEVSALRNSITENASTISNYLSSIAIRGILPFLLLYFLIKKDIKMYLILLLLGSFYCFSLMQKSYIVTFLLPCFIFCVLKIRWLFMLKLTAIIGGVVVGLVYISNPTPPVKTVIKENVAPKSSIPLVNVLNGIQHRMFVVPGEIVSSWFDEIPKNKPYLKGQGYRFYAKLVGQPHIDYSKELYPIIRPKFAKQGYTGTVNTASFVYDYSNFGYLGLVLGGCIIAFFLVIIELVYQGNFVEKISFNLFHITLLSSAAITTLAFSGGWLFLILLYLLFLRTPKKV